MLVSEKQCWGRKIKEVCTGKTQKKGDKRGTGRWGKVAMRG